MIVWAVAEVFVGIVGAVVLLVFCYGLSLVEVYLNQTVTVIDTVHLRAVYGASSSVSLLAMALFLDASIPTIGAFTLTVLGILFCIRCPTQTQPLLRAEINLH